MLLIYMCFLLYLNTNHVLHRLASAIFVLHKLTPIILRPHFDHLGNFADCSWGTISTCLWRLEFHLRQHLLFALFANFVGAWGRALVAMTHQQKVCCAHKHGALPNLWSVHFGFFVPTNRLIIVNADSIFSDLTLCLEDPLCVPFIVRIHSW